MMRFNAKFTATLIASVFAASLISGQSTYAETTKQSTSEKKSTPVVAKKEVVKVVKVTVKLGESLSSIAETQKTTWVRIFNANETISDPNTVNPGDELVIPTVEQELPDRYAQYAAQAAAVAPVATASYTTRSYSAAPVNSNSYYVGNGMWCTDYVHSKRSDIPVYGNAGYSWITAAQAQGKATGTTAQAGAVAVTNGHVAYVESVNADGSYVVSEMGWNYKAGSYNTRTVSPGAFGQFIY